MTMPDAASRCREKLRAAVIGALTAMVPAARKLIRANTAMRVTPTRSAHPSLARTRLISARARKATLAMVVFVRRSMLARYLVRAM